MTSAQNLFTKMERKEKPIVPSKPRHLSVSEKAKFFDAVIAEVAETVGGKSIKISASESDIHKPNTKNNFDELTDHNVDVDADEVTTETLIK